uniref:Interleukin-21 receptor-like n=1 Tax=Erpetoichthys calabaricus TaxID=27687 RepID=A0A8C4SMT8_ERPCA
MLHALVWLFFLSITSFLEYTLTETTDDQIDFTCLSDYIYTVTCTLTMKEDSPEESNVSYLVEAEDIISKNKGNCTIVKHPGNFPANCSLEMGESMKDLDSYDITLQRIGSEKTIVYLKVIPEYFPSENIKPVTPINLSVNYDEKQYKLTWNTGYDSNNYLPRNLQYELMYWQKGRSLLNPKIGKRINDITSLNIGETELQKSTTYLARVRSGPNNISYHGHWSEWSIATEWTTRPSDVQKPHVSPYISTVGMPFALGLIILIAMYFDLPTRLKNKICAKVPTPAPFLQPLYNNDKGGFRSWFLSPGNLNDELKKEEALKIDHLIETKPHSVEASKEDFCKVLYVTKDQHNENCPANTESGSNAVAAHSKNHVTSPPSFFNSHDESFSSHFLENFESIDSGCFDVNRSSDETEKETNISYDVPPEPESLCYSDDYCTLSEANNGLIPSKKVKDIKATCGKCIEIGLKGPVPLSSVTDWPV